MPKVKEPRHLIYLYEGRYISLCMTVVKMVTPERKHGYYAEN